MTTVRVRLAAPVASPAGPVALVDATVRVQCKDGSVSARAVKVRTADDKPLPLKQRRLAVNAVRPSLDKTLSSPAFIDKVCLRPAA